MRTPPQRARAGGGLEPAFRKRFNFIRRTKIIAQQEGVHCTGGVTPKSHKIPQAPKTHHFHCKSAPPAPLHPCSLICKINQYFLELSLVRCNPPHPLPSTNSVSAPRQAPTRTEIAHHGGHGRHPPSDPPPSSPGGVGGRDPGLVGVVRAACSATFSATLSLSGVVL